MKTVKKILLITGIVFILFIILLVTLPFLFKDKINEQVKIEINKNVNAQVDWSAFGISFIRNFPNISFRLDDFTVTGIHAFEGDTLVSVKNFRLVFDVKSVIRSIRYDDQIIIRSIQIGEPKLFAKVLEDGTANWDILKEVEEKPIADEPTAPPSFNIGLQRFEVNNAQIIFDDKSSDIYATVSGLNHSLSGDFTQDLFTLRTRTTANELSIRFAGIPYLNRVALDVKADIEADMVNKKFSFKENEIRLNELFLAFTGTTALGEDEVEIDITFHSPKTDFKHVLSLIPAIYMQDFQKLQTAGNFSIEGLIKGSYSTEKFPSLGIDLKVADAMFRYPDLPLPAQNIFADLSITNPGGDIDNTVVHLKRFHVEIGDNPFDASMIMRTPVSDPDIDFTAKGIIDLTDVSKTVKLENMEELTGIINADIALRTKISYIENEQYDRISARGNIDIREMAVKNEEIPHTVKIDEMMLAFSPEYAEMKTFKANIGSSDIEANGYLDNLLGFVLRDEQLKGRATFSSNYFILDEWQSDDDLEIIPVPANVDFSLNGSIKRLVFDKIEITDAVGSIHIKDQKVTLENFRMKTLEGEVTMNGFYETTDITMPSFDFNLTINNLNILKAFNTFTTVQLFAPVAQYASGFFSASLRMHGALGENMMPLFDILNARGSLRTSNIALMGFPPINQISELIKVPHIKDPGLDDIRAMIEIKDGRLHVNPFDVRLGKSKMNVNGSNGIDQTLNYVLGLEIPRTELGTEANRFISNLISEAGRHGVNLQAADAVKLNIILGGTITRPSIRTNFADVVLSAREQIEQIIRDEIEKRIDEVEERVDTAIEEARQKAQAEADRIMREAEQRAAQIRQEASKLAESVRQEGYRQADRLLEEATNPIARAAARPAADRLRKESDDKASQIIKEADRRADEILQEARRKADELLREF